MKTNGTMNKSWPKPGDKVVFAGEHSKLHWFRDVLENAEKLENGKAYTIATIEVLSSWVKITLEGFNDLRFCLNHFKYEESDTERKDS